MLGASIGELALTAIDPQGGRNSAHALLGRIIAWVIVTGGVTAMLALWRRSENYKALNHASELQRLRTERMLDRLRAEALQRQIEPHFLFNTLATIRRLHDSDPSKGRLLLSRFLAFLRGTIDAGREVGLETAVLGRAGIGFEGDESAAGNEAAREPAIEHGAAHLAAAYEEE